MSGHAKEYFLSPEAQRFAADRYQLAIEIVEVGVAAKHEQSLHA